MSSARAAVRAAVRCGGPAALAALAWWLGQPPTTAADRGAAAGALAVAALLLCPGWGLLRVLSGVDRRFGVLGSSLCLSLLVLGLLGRTGSGPGLPALAHATALALCVAGGLRQALFDRWQRRQPPHPAPMPLWPARWPACLLVLALALAAVSASPAAQAPPPPDARAPGAHTPDTDAPGATAPDARAPGFHAAVVGALAGAAGLSQEAARRAVAVACLAAVLLFAAEGIARLRGNRGAPLAMLALLLGYRPLDAALAVAAAGRPWSAAHAATALHAAAADGSLTAALAPFLDGSPLALALAFAAMLLSTTLSVLRRASRHVPRLAGAASFGLVLALPGSACVLLPGWILGVYLAHRMCRRAAAADPASVATVRRAGEPALLRAPFWALAVPIAGSALAAWLLLANGGSATGPTGPTSAGGAQSAAPAEVVSAPAWPTGRPVSSPAESSAIALALFAALLPAAVLLVPGVRQLNASPGREAFFFAGLLLGACAAGLLWTLPGAAPHAGPGDALARLLSLLLAVPVGNGALVLLSRPGAPGRRVAVALALAALALLPASLALLR
ncbi:MAG TPA: hypothetical protein VK824_12770 [Planctomycetota bacterium]|nr:hypothetical protein [Planctomycetota bacterium]